MHLGILICFLMRYDLNVYFMYDLYHHFTIGNTLIRIKTNYIYLIQVYIYGIYKIYIYIYKR